MSEVWQDFLDELDRRIEVAEVDDPARAVRLKAMRPKLRATDPERGEDALADLAPKFGLTMEEQ